VKILPLPMFARYFVSLVFLTIGASVLFGVMFGNYLERTTAATIAPIWAAAIKDGNTQRAEAPHQVLDVRVPIDVFVGTPPAHAYSIANDQRARALAEALAASGVSVVDTWLDDVSDRPVTWLRVQPADGAARWVGFEGGVQPPLFRTRTWRALLGLLILMAVAAWFASRWVVRPLARLSRQVDAIGRGEVPTEVVRGPREIERFAGALTTMAHQRAAFDEQRRTMLMGVSHDLRSPLARIRVAADLLEREPALRELLVRNVEHADQIIESFLSYVRTDAEPMGDRVDVAAVVNSAARLLQLPAEQVHVDGGVGGVGSAVVRGNATLLQRLLVNLLDNASKHGAPPVTLALDRDAKTREVVLTVADCGLGIVDPQRMMLPFERGDASRGKTGTGLGLALAMRIVQRHGGRLAIDAPPGGGTRVRVWLPAAS
jgi:two-component system osmolarity sensor histidine kinase EnvZ